MRALSRIPRDKAIEGIHAFNEMKYVALVDLLRHVLTLLCLLSGMIWSSFCDPLHKMEK